MACPPELFRLRTNARGMAAGQGLNSAFHLPEVRGSSSTWPTWRRSVGQRRRTPLASCRLVFLARAPEEPTGQARRRLSDPVDRWRGQVQRSAWRRDVDLLVRDGDDL